RVCLLSCRRRAALVHRPDCVQRSRHCSRYARGAEGADPAPATGTLRRAGMVTLGHLARRVEPVRVPDNDGLLPRRVSAVAQIPAADRIAPRNGMSNTPRQRLPGDHPPDEEIARMLRVDHAGEYGATRIYEGQLDVLGRGRAAGAIRQMAETEKRHLDRFETLLRER